MLNPEAELRDLVRSLEENAVEDRSHIHVAEVRALVAKGIRATHEILHPGCELTLSNDTLRLALVDLDRGSR